MFVHSIQVERITTVEVEKVVTKEVPVTVEKIVTKEVCVCVANVCTVRRLQAKAPALVRVRGVRVRAHRAGSCSNILSSKILLEYSYSDGRDA